MKKRIMTVLILAALAAGISSGHMYIGKATEIKRPSEKESTLPKDHGQTDGQERTHKMKDSRKRIQVKKVRFERLSDKEIRLQWPVPDLARQSACVKNYVIKRRRPGEDRWQTLHTQTGCSYVDTLREDAPQQYEYRVDVNVKDRTKYKAERGTSILASNILICIDPGHYEGQNVVDDGGIVYAEGDFTLGLAKEVKKILAETYGISSYLTRESGTITLGGYTDGGLDGGHINLRGEYASGSDLFLSLHTDANLENANGYGTFEQPVSITKPIVIANTLACESTLALAVGNAVGESLAEANTQMGIAEPGKFQVVEGSMDMVPWTDAFNDGTEDPGTICYRLGDAGDYYGVLRGAADVGVPGLIIEHGFHTVPRMRQLAAEGELERQWARADAQGIAGGIESVLQELWE